MVLERKRQPRQPIKLLSEMSSLAYLVKRTLTMPEPWNGLNNLIQATALRVCNSLEPPQILLK